MFHYTLKQKKGIHTWSRCTRLVQTSWYSLTWSSSLVSGNHLKFYITGPIDKAFFSQIQACLSPQLTDFNPWFWTEMAQWPLVGVAGCIQELREECDDQIEADRVHNSKCLRMCVLRFSQITSVDPHPLPMYNSQANPVSTDIFAVPTHFNDVLLTPERKFLHI